MVNISGKWQVASGKLATISGGASLKRFISLLLLVACNLLLVSPARAVLTIEITQSYDGGMPIAIVPFKWDGPAKQAPQDIAGIIESDLLRSGRFNAIPKTNFVSQPHEHKDVVFKDWRISKAEALVIGTLRQIAPGRYIAEFRLYDVFKETQLSGYMYIVEEDSLRRVAHQISDLIYEKLTGEPGAFNTRIAYVVKEGAGKAQKYKLQVADSDGYDAITILTSPESILSPAWSPDGTRLAYVSLEQRRSTIYIQNVATGDRVKVAEHKGLNGAPAWSPDGGRLALTLSKDGNPEIYVLRLADNSLERLTNHPAIDTEPAWSPDGRQIVFTSGRAGRPNIYRMSADGGKVERITVDGEYNARASYSADGSMLTLVSAKGGRFHTAVMHLKGSVLQLLTDTSLDESPSFAPNGRIILYATSVQGRGVLASVSSDGRVRQVLKSQDGDIREPAWSPFNRQLQPKE